MYIQNTVLFLAQMGGELAALCAFNANNADMAVAIVEESDNLQKPVIVQVTVQTLDLYYWHPLVVFVRDLAERAKTPVALHLDHAKTVSDALRSAEMGFSSVMYDGSALPYRENMEKTRRLVRRCHGLNVAVEGEIGHVGSGTDDRDTSLLTDLKKAWIAAQGRCLDEDATDPRRLVRLGRRAVREAVREKMAAVEGTEAC